MDERGCTSRASLSLSLSLSERELCEVNLDGGSSTGDPGGCVYEDSGDGHLSA